MTSLIEARLLRKSFGPVPALRGVSLDLQVGELVGLLGSNGAGKTTLIRCLASLVRPDGGQVLVNGEDLFGSSSARLRARLGLVGHQTLLYDSLTAEENLSFYASLYEVAAAPRRIGMLLEEFGLLHRSQEPVRALSRGMQQRLALARAFLHEPEILLLDEPAAGLDPAAGELLQNRLEGLRQRGGAALIASHDIAATLALADRYVMLRAGRLVAAAPAPGADPRRLREEHYPPAPSPMGSRTTSPVAGARLGGAGR